jgi:ribosomal protein L22
MDHLSPAPHLRAKIDALTIKTSRVFKQHLVASDVALADEAKCTIRGKRTAHMLAIELEKIERPGCKPRQRSVAHRQREVSWHAHRV